ncbi:hypothetical protein GCM10009090_33980 [[Pseudomonas] boreopolis]|uniref:Uncharacterized protein n=1 Tax=Xanthomonas boreopolis TaxID=86183 RepID=A0A919FBZ6_9XANT|nr:hypothetical protein GCM10009090_33980 [[Pseudomonas] boreopolis]
MPSPAAISMARGPETRSIPTPPAPAAVAMATMVSLLVVMASWVKAYRYRSVKLLLLVILLLLFAFDLPGPSVAAETVGKTPKGRRTWMCVVFGRGRMPRPKIPPAPRTRSKAAGAKAGCAFFGLPFFAQAKKGNSPKAKALAFIAKCPKAKVPG